MSNFISQNSTTPSLPVFIQSLAVELSAMHLNNTPHGDITGDGRQWLDSGGALFEPEKFRATAVQSTGDPEALIREDVNGFIKCSRFWITANSPCKNAAFKADHYTGNGLPIAFLKLLESDNHDNHSQLRIMSDYCALLSAETPPAEEAPAISTPEKAILSDTTPISISLRNGTVGKPYEIEPAAIARAIAKQRNDDPERSRISHLQLPVDCGLLFHEATGSVTGTPIRQLEELLYLDYVPSPNAVSITCKVSLLINPDPASLWKDLTPAEDAPYQKDLLYDKEYILGDFRVIAASRRGRAHANKGDFRDDDFAVGYADSTGWLVVVVADGAGSAKYSRKGSQIACKAASERLVASLNFPEYETIIPPQMQQDEGEAIKPRKLLRELLYEAALDAHYKIREEAEKPSETLPESPSIRNYDTTLILLVMKKLARGCFTATFSIGDGGAGIFHTPDQAEPLTHADGGEHAGQTTFVTIASTLSNDPENLDKRFRMSTSMDFTAALVMTDGITDPKFPSDAAFSDPNCWKALWMELEPVLASSKSLLGWMNFFSPGNHDDRTLVAVLPAITLSEE
jgi:serine/threonine protein phosphatase PrpC